jgi:hypothetical protein
MLFKINGERNSGTNFLYKLLQANHFPVYDQELKNKICYYWKHGIPDPAVKKLSNRVVDIFIFRNINSWLKSTWKNPYHLKPIRNYKDFLTSKQMSITPNIYDHKTCQPVNIDDDHKTIFQIRYYKFNKILEYKDNNKDVIFVNLDYLQNSHNAHNFIQTLNDTYIHNSHLNIVSEITKHTKDKSDQKNRIIDTDTNCTNIINTYTDHKIESFINTLTFYTF